jgi:cysteine desulfurase
MRAPERVQGDAGALLTYPSIMDGVYLDHAATTPLRAEVRAAMEPFLGGAFGNPSSTHGFGRRTAAALMEARERVADALAAHPSEIYFVRGGTESDNLAVLGRATVARRQGRIPHVAHTAVEHPAVVEACRAVEREGGHRTELPVDRECRPVEEALAACLDLRPDVLSVLWVNNETGSVLPVPEVAERCRSQGVVLHTDAVQAVGKLEVRLDRSPVDLLTATGHKIQGPRGTGILFVRRGTEILPIVHGGGQERGLRPGTEDVAGAVGMAEALALAVQEREGVAHEVAALRDRLEARLEQSIDGLRRFGDGGDRAPHVACVGIPGVDQALLLAGLDLEGIACSAGSACHSGASGGAASSHVLRAIHGAETRGFAVLRFSFASLSEAADVDRAVAATVSVVERLGARAPEIPGAGS